jgi:hypothetical protein
MIGIHHREQTNKIAADSLNSGGCLFILAK